MTIMQGDSYGIEVTLLDLENQIITPSGVEDVEIILGGIRKKYADGGITFANDAWIFPVTQQETFSLRPVKYPFQTRVKVLTGDVVGAYIGDVTVKKSYSKGVI